MDNATQGEINRWLALSYGTDNDKRPNYRLVWAPNQRENRWGTFHEYSGRIFLREFIGVKDLPKYQEHGEVYVIEKLVPNYQPDVLVGVKFSYEPIWIFNNKDKDGNIMHPWLEAIQFFMKMAVDGPKMAATRAVMDKGDSYDQEVDLFSDELQHEAPNLAYDGGLSMSKG